MSANTTVDITFYRFGSFAEMVGVLRQAGWTDLGPTVLYEHYRDVIDIGDEKQASSKEWPRVLESLESFLANGETVCISLRHEDRDATPKFCYQVEGELGRLTVHFLRPGPALSPGGKLTDFGWVAAKVVQPFIDAGYGLLDVTYSDDFR